MKKPTNNRRSGLGRKTYGRPTKPTRTERPSEERSEKPRAERPERRDEEEPRPARRDDAPRNERPRPERRSDDRPRAPRRDDSPRDERRPRPERRDDDRPRPARRDDRPSDRGDKPRFDRPDAPRGKRPFSKDRDDRGPGRPTGTRGDRPVKREPERDSRRPNAPRGFGPAGPGRDERSGDRPFAPRPEGGFRDRPRAPFRKDAPPRDREARDNRPGRASDQRGDRPSRPRNTPYRENDRPFRPRGKAPKKKQTDKPEDGLVRLNRYLAQSGVASRRAADDMIKAGVVMVNGVVVSELGTKVRPEDKVVFGGQRVSMEQKRYVLLNKPKDTITTTDDPEDRHTVMSLVAKACPERLYPVGRLDRNTTGVLLLTNDGDLAKRLTHPSHGAEKIYHVTLDKSVVAADLQKLVDGVDLEDGPAHADEASYVDASEGRREVGLKLHMGRNRIVRRMFEALGYEVVKLDRVLFAGLTKKDLQRSHWRHLTEKEVTLLKRMKDAPKSTKAERGGRRTRLSQGSE